MAGGKETPRQKMVGLMYLVLMALLAMNVSKSILQAFVVINEGMETTNHHFIDNNERTYTAFDKAKMNDPVKVTPYWEKAQKVKQYANDVYEYIEHVKKMNINFVEKYDPTITPESVTADNVDWSSIPDSMFNLKNVQQLDQYDAPTNLMIGGEPATPKGADVPWSSLELKARLQGFKDNLSSLFKGDNHEEAVEMLDDIERAIEFKAQKHGDHYEEWEVAQFYHLPLAAVVTNLSKMQADVRSLEADVIKALLGEVSADDFKFDRLEAKVIPNSNYVFLGDTFKAEVLVAALSTTQDPVLEAGTKIDTTGKKVTIAEADIMKDNIRYKDGKGIFKMVPNSEGTTVWGGVIKIKKPNGDLQPFYFTHEFTAAKPALVVSPTAMNLMYRGLDNPIEVSVPGVPTELLKVSVTNGSQAGSRGKFTVKPGAGQIAEVSVSATINGKTRSFGKVEFRVKNVPDPKPKFAGSKGDVVKYNDVKAAQGVIAEMENFEFDGVKFTVTSFVISATIKGKVIDQASKNNRLTEDQKTLLKNIGPGDKFYIEKITAVGPDGTPRNLGSLSFKII
jgi:gliding motility-associated protein GldM